MIKQLSFLPFLILMLQFCDPFIFHWNNQNPLHSFHDAAYSIITCEVTKMVRFHYVLQCV